MPLGLVLSLLLLLLGLTTSMPEFFANGSKRKNGCPSPIVFAFSSLTLLYLSTGVGNDAVFSNPKMSLKEAKGRRSGFCPFGR
jgi:hypothetical protein